MVMLGNSVKYGSATQCNSKFNFDICVFVFFQFVVDG